MCVAPFGHVSHIISYYVCRFFAAVNTLRNGQVGRGLIGVASLCELRVIIFVCFWLYNYRQHKCHNIVLGVSYMYWVARDLLRLQPKIHCIPGTHLTIVTQYLTSRGHHSDIANSNLKLQSHKLHVLKVVKTTYPEIICSVVILTSSQLLLNTLCYT